MYFYNNSLIIIIIILDAISIGIKDFILTFISDLFELRVSYSLI
jgi:hypothetical protein